MPGVPPFQASGCADRCEKSRISLKSSFGFHMFQMMRHEMDGSLGFFRRNRLDDVGMFVGTAIGSVWCSGNGP